VEINFHGGISTTNKVLELLLENGARLAEPGEFTKRAFLNGRIDLLEAEATMDLISSKSETARKLSINTLTGETSNLIKNLRNKLIQIISNIEVNIDYPEYEDVEELTNDKILPSINEFREDLINIINKSEDSKTIKEGIKVGIIGKPNVGKSSLLNSLIEEEKAIVTDIPGTTRDIVEGTIILDGIILNIVDTAGIRDTLDVVEKIGVEKSLSVAENSDLVIFILNNNEEMSSEEKELLLKLKNKKMIIVVNKIDLETKLDKSILDHYIEISVKEKIGIDKIKDKIRTLFNLGEIETSDLTYLSNARSISLLHKSLKNIDEAIAEINCGSPIDIVEFSLKDAWNNLGEITGEVYTDELLDELFSRFCLGK
ncbi:MAG: tRNA uridine-5-carboxymethylaminomethyl(34) synthesis GTPase MnmE, partial [Bacilli bacterium]